MLPEGWRKLPLCDVAEIRTGIAKNERISGEHIDIPYLRVANVQDGNIDIKEIKSIKIEKNKISRYLLQYGDVLMTEGGDFDKLGRGDVWKEQISPCVHQNHVFAVRPNQNKLNSEFLSALASSNYGRLYFLSCAKRSTNLASINATQLKKFPVILPPLSEQNAIIVVLSIWDKAISTTDILLANSRQQKKALMQQLLTGKRRLPGFTGEWKFPRARKLFKNISIKHRPEETLLAVTQTEGVIPRHLLDRRVVMPDGDVNLYKLVKKGDFIISLRSFQGGLEYSSYQGLVSPAYTVITKCCDIDDMFYKHYFKSALFIGKLAVAVIGIRDGKQISYEDFSCIRLPYPPLDEQRAIATVLDAADREIVLLEQKAARLREEKKALMQQLLTGKRRVRL